MKKVKRYARVGSHCRFRDEGDYILITLVRTYIRNVKSKRG